ncbi:MAG: hypothetical protein ABIX12_16855, partial [Rubrivivax sp.]
MSRTSRDSDLHARRVGLQARAAALRSDFRLHVKVLQPPLAAIDRVRGGLAWLSRRPLWPAAALAVSALLATRRRRPAAVAGRRAASTRGIGGSAATSAQWGKLGRWTARAWGGWRMVRGGLRALRASHGRPPG